jgi:hypothetical protein
LMIAIESHQDDIAALLVPHSNLTHTLAHARSHTFACMHARTRMHTHTRSHTPATAISRIRWLHTYTYTRTCVNTHTQSERHQYDIVSVFFSFFFLSRPPL